jgi:hypothetical protein
VLTKRVKDLEQAILNHLAKPPPELPIKRLEQLLGRFELLMTQLNKHVNPTRDEVTLLKRTNRELAKELVTVHNLLKKENE